MVRKQRWRRKRAGELRHRKRETPRNTVDNWSGGEAARA